MAGAVVALKTLPVEKFVLKELETLLSQQKIQAEWKGFEVQKIRLRVVFKDITLRGGFIEKAPIHWEKLFVELAPLRSLLQGSLVFNIYISGWRHFFDLSGMDSKKGYNEISNVPIHKIVIQKAHFRVKTPGEQTVVFENTALKLKRKLRNLSVNVSSDLKLDEFSYKMKNQLSISDKGVQVHDFQLKSDSIYADLSGFVDKDFNVSDFNVDSHINSKELKLWLNIWKPFVSHIPEGVFQFKAEETSCFKKTGCMGSFEFQSKPFLWKNFSADHIRLEGSIDKKEISLSMAHFEKNKKWTAFLENTKIHLDESWSFSAKNYSHIKDFRAIEKMLDWNIGLQLKGPVESLCQGSLKNIKIQCHLQAHLDHVSLKPKPSPLSIVESGPLRLTADLVWIEEGESSIKGEIASQNQSQIQFQSSLKDVISFNGVLNLSDIESVYGLEAEGKADILNGSITFKGSDFSVQSKTRFKDFVLSRVHLGQLQTGIEVNNQEIRFQSIQGQLGQSEYRGNIHIPFSPKIALKVHADFSPLFLEDLSQSLKKVLPLPVSVSGEGSAQVVMESPLEVDKLNYRIKSSFKNIALHTETFKDMEIHVESKKGLVQIQKAQIRKIKGELLAQGRLHPSLNLDMRLTATDWLIERSEFLNQWIGADLSGVFGFEMKLKGPVFHPQVELEGNIKESFYKTVPLGPGGVRLSFYKDYFEGSGHFFNNKIQIDDFKYSFVAPKKVSFKVEAKNWSAAPFISYLGSDFSSQLTGKAFFHFPVKNFLNTSGYLDVDQFSVRLRDHEILSKKPFYIQMDGGEFSFRGSSLEWESGKHTLFVKKINRNESLVSGEIPLQFLSLFFPFIENAGGILKTHFNIQNNLNQLSPKGTLQVEGKSFAVSNYLDIFQSIEMQGELSPSQMTIKNFNVQTLTGFAKGFGEVLFQKEGLPVDIQGDFTDMAFYISDQLKALGSGSVQFHGTRPPYVLSSAFYLKEGYFKGEFNSPENSSQKTSPHLSAAKKKEQELFHWDTHIHFENPFLIENNLVFALLKGSFYMSGLASLPQLTGELSFIPGGVFHLREYDFEDLTGFISYNNQHVSMPYLNLSGKTEFEDITYVEDKEVSRNYQVTAHVKGPVGGIELRFSSQPPLPETDILSMMALGARSVDFLGDTSSLTDVARYSYYQIGSALFQSSIGHKLQNLLGMRISVSPYVNTATNRPTTKIGLHKRWSKKFKTSLNTSIDDIDRSLKLEYDLSPHFSLFGVWKNNEILDQTESNELGLELEYRINF